MVSLSLAAALTGCAQTGSPADAPKATPAAAHGSSPAGQVMGLKEAGETYERLAARSNRARDAWLHAPKLSKATFAKHRTLAAQAAKVSRDFATGLRTHRWPVQAQRPVDVLRKDLEDREAAYRRVASARSLGEYVAAARRVPLNSEATVEVRRSLKLPKASNFCFCDSPTGPTAG
jgi:hypothetical protein